MIIGQDPYHQFGQAHGLAFSCLKQPLPLSLKNIFKAIESNGFDVNYKNGDLSRYVHQGVLLWNTYLSVIEGKPLSHKSDAYVTLTKKLIQKIVDEKSHLVFMLHINMQNINDYSSKTGKLSLIDLAGSEKISKTGATG